MSCVAVIDEDLDFIALVQEVLLEQGLETCGFEQYDVTLDALKRIEPALVLLDLRQDQPNGIGLIERLKADTTMRHVPIIAWAAVPREIEGRRDWFREEQIGLLSKPFEIDDLLTCVDSALHGPQPSCTPDVAT